MRTWVSRFVGWASTWMMWASPVGFGLPHWGHHRYMDTARDPHSPRHRGYIRSLSYWTHMAPESGRDLLRAIASLRPLIDDLFQMNLYRNTIAWCLTPLIWVIPLALVFGLWPAIFYTWVLPSGAALMGILLSIAIHWFDGPHDIPGLRWMGLFENLHAHHHRNPRDSQMDGGWRVASKILGY